MVNCVNGLVVSELFNWNVTCHTPTVPGNSLALTALAVEPPARMESTGFNGGELRLPSAGVTCPVFACRGLSGPSPVARIYRFSPGIAGLSLVTWAPSVLAQQVAVPNGVMMTFAVELA